MSDNNETIDQPVQEPTTAGSLMRSSGYVADMTGRAISAGSILYFANFMTTFGCSVLEKLPEWLSDKAEFSKMFEGKNIGSLRSYCILGVCLGLGIGFKKFGTFMTTEKYVRAVETFLYGKKSLSTVR